MWGSSSIQNRASFPMCLPSRTTFFLLAALIFVIARPEGLYAQELGYSGLGPINSSFGGATASVPLDGSGAMFWNPATIGKLDKGEFQFGFGRENAPWYGDESLGYTILLPVAAIAWLGAEALRTAGKAEDTWNKYQDIYSDHSNGNSNAGYSNGSDDVSDPPYIPYIKQRNFPIVRGLNLSFVTAPEPYSNWNYGLAFNEFGGRKQRLIVDNTTGKAVALELYRVRSFELTPTVSWRCQKQLTFGISPIFSWDDHPNASLPDLPGYRFEGDQRNHFGMGLQLGVYWTPKSDFRFGASIRSPQWMPEKTYQWINDTTGDLITRQSHFTQDSPLRSVFGVSYHGFDRMVIAIDARHYDFHHIAPLYNMTANRGKRDVTSLALGWQYELADHFVVRIGYEFSDGRCTYQDLVNNTSLPIQSGHSLHYGFTFGDQDAWDISFSISHAFNDQKIRLPSGSYTASLDGNPNNNAFWWGLRIHF